MPDPALAKGPKHCPPGLAKKSPACVPPGQAKKGVSGKNHSDAYRDDDDYEVGERIEDYTVLRVGDRVVFDGNDYIVVDTDGTTVLRRDNDYYRLPVYGDGTEYVRVGDSLIRVSPQTRTIIDFVRLADLILG
jgi:hypothetical protein